METCYEPFGKIGSCTSLPDLPQMPRPTSVGRDTGLQVRMTLTMFLLGVLYVALIAALLAAGVGGVTVAVIAGGLFLLQIFTSDKLALYAMGGHEVSPGEAPELHAMVERLCIQADLPKPRVAVAQTSMPNAFARRGRPPCARPRGSWDCFRRPSWRACSPTSSPTSRTGM
jgi:Zn-dependent protease with chaperone function